MNISRFDWGSSSKSNDSKSFSIDSSNLSGDLGEFSSGLSMSLEDYVLIYIPSIDFNNYVMIFK